MIKKVGFIGVGMMGGPMAKNLLKAGFDVVAYDISKDALSRIVAEGAIEGKNPAQVTDSTDIIITMLPTSTHVEKAVFGENGIIESIRQGKILIDMSTIEPTASKSIAARIEEKEGQMLDAPVSGGQVGAINGTLTIMIGGKKENVDKCRHVFEAMGKNIIHIGEEVGMGETIKIVNNLINGIIMIATAEGLLLGKKAGLSLETMYDVVTKGSGNSWTLETYFPRTVLKENYEPGFMLDLMYKDVGLALSLAKDVGMPLQLGAICHQFYQWGRTAGKGRKDYAILWEIMKDAYNA